MKLSSCFGQPTRLSSKQHSTTGDKLVNTMVNRQARVMNIYSFSPPLSNASRTGSITLLSFLVSIVVVWFLRCHTRESLLDTLCFYRQNSFWMPVPKRASASDLLSSMEVCDRLANSPFPQMPLVDVVPITSKQCLSFLVILVNHS